MALLLFVPFLLLRAPLSGAAVPVEVTVVVDSKGGGNFTSVQQAIDFIPDDNQRWTKIHITAGVYTEKVKLPWSKGKVLIEGEGPQATTIQWGDYADVAMLQAAAGMFLNSEPSDTATFTSEPDDVVFKGITFKNTYEDIGNLKIGVAMMVLGDRASFYSCSFVGVQDTLCDLQGRHYFKDCMIQGAVDFVYGYGQTIYEDCYLVTVPGLPVPGWVTANGRSGPDQPGGFVFKNCWLYGGSKVYLGRAWGSYSRVIFYNTNMSDIVVPQGWDSWLTPDKGANTTYGEAGCTGPGSNGQFRVPWEKKLSPDAVQQFTDITYVDPEGWLAKQAWA